MLYLTVIVVVLSILHPVTSSLSWLLMTSLDDVQRLSNDVRQCERRLGSVLVRRQRALLCLRQQQLIDVIKHSAVTAVKECQHQFQNEIWNCVLDTKITLRKLEKAGSREAAYTESLVSASVTHSVTSYCRAGLLTDCGCGLPSPTITSSTTTTTQTHFIWSGCNLDTSTQYGAEVSRTFVDATGKHGRVDNIRTTIHRLINLHNNNVGRKVVETSYSIHCKCHGVSGSCDVKTCWRSLPTFHTIGSTLKSLYHSATRLRSTSSRSWFDTSPVVQGGSLSESIRRNAKRSSPTGLVYLNASPDPCLPDNARGVTTSHGRLCGNEETGAVACGQMCCGRGHVTRRRTVVDSRCQCRFRYCCYVTCELCQQTIVEYICR